MAADVLVVAGEASGDRIAALVAAELAASGVACWGVGGAACRRAGVETIADSSAIAAMGISDVAVRAMDVGRAVARIAARARSSPPGAALLVNFTELNQRVGRALRARGVRVLWCVAPQVWAWRPGRLHALHGAFDRLAVILPFEEALWRDAGHAATFIGHPSWCAEPPPADPPARVAVLPGSRAGEVGRLATPLVEAARALVADGSVASGAVLLAPGLPERARATIRDLAHRTGLEPLEVDATDGAGPLLRGFRVALCASGTASLDAALAGAAPVVAYRLDALAYALAKRFVRTPHVALPNVLLGRGAYPERLQQDATADRIAEAARGLLRDRAATLANAGELRALLAPPSPLPFGRLAADLVLPWLGR